MKLEKENYVLNGEGQVQITAECVEDFSSLSNIIQIGDIIHSQIRRKVTKVSSSGKADSKSVLAFASVEIKEIDYQPGVDEMQLRGILKTAVEDAKPGSYQRVLISIGRPFTLTKSCWDKFTIQELREASDPTFKASICACIMQSGIANICIVGKNSSVKVAEITKSIPKIKSRGGSNSEQKLKFFQMTVQALDKAITNDMRCIIIASPGFWQKEFLQYLNDNAQKYLKIQKALQENLFILGTVPTGHIQELDNLLAQPQFQKYVEDLKATKQAKLMHLFLKTLNKDDNTTATGYANVIKCYEMGAISHLLVTDAFVRALPREDKIKFNDIMEELEKQKSVVVVFQKTNPSGEQLHALGGIAAILKFQIQLEEDHDNDEFDHGFDDY